MVFQEGSNLVMTRDAGTVAAGKHADNARFASLVSAGGGHAVLAYEQGKAGESRIVVEKL